MARVAAAFMVESEQRVTEGTRHADEPPILAVTRYPNRVAVARAQAMAAQNALIIEKARRRYIHQGSRVDRCGAALRARDRVATRDVKNP